MRILITGGSSEIAQAIARSRLARGDEILVTASSEESLKDTMKAYKELGLDVTGLEYSLSEPERCAESVELAMKGGIDALVLNAATRSVKLRRFHEWDERDGTEYMRSNIDGNVWLLRKLLPSMMERHFGRVVFISSLSVVQGTSRFPYYCLSKSAIEGLFLNLAVDYGEFNVYFNIVRPGIIATERTKRFWKRSHYLEKVKNIIPAMRLGAAAQVAEAVDPLLSSTGFMNGSVVTVSGGLPLMRSAGILGV